YYLNLRPNLDMTLTPRYMTERGLQLASELRYLGRRTEGQLDFEYLPDDDETRTTRRYVNLQHQTVLGASWLIEAGIEEVSDAAYFDDLGTSLSVTSQTNLNRYVGLAFFAPYWSLRARFQNYQTIDPEIAPADEPYERVP